VVVCVEYEIYRMTGAGKLILNYKITMTRQKYFLLRMNLNNTCATSLTARSPPSVEIPYVIRCGHSCGRVDD
jgi:hypothetical protein